MSRRKNTVLNKQSRTMVFDVYNFMKKSAEDSDSAISVLEIYKMTADATKTSISTVRRIIKEANSSVMFKTPGKKRPRNSPVTSLDSIDQGVIKRAIHNFHMTNKELITVDKLRRKLREDISFQGSEVSLRRVIKRMGFKWKKTSYNKKILIEKSIIRFQRIEYLQKMKKYREEERNIVYTDESYFDSAQSCPSAWLDGSTEGLQKTISKGPRAVVVIVHAATETGFVPNALLTFKAVTKSRDYHDNINYETYEKWLHTQLIPNISPRSVVVINNASYHNKQYNPAPTSNAEKAVMLAWLREKGIHHDENMLKPQLHHLIKAHKDQNKQFNIDEILGQCGHSVLRLPPYHPDLNPIEMAWATIKKHVRRENVSVNLDQITDLIKEKVDVMDASEWGNLCEKVKKIEEEYCKSDHAIDSITEELIISMNDDSDSDSSSDTENTDDDDCE